jgi:hypothetical protein
MTQDRERLRDIEETHLSHTALKRLHFGLCASPASNDRKDKPTLEKHTIESRRAHPRAISMDTFTKLQF